MPLASSVVTISGFGGGFVNPNNVLTSNNVYATGSGTGGVGLYFQHNASSLIPAGKVHVGTVLTVEARPNVVYTPAGFSPLSGDWNFPLVQYNSTADKVYTVGSSSDTLGFDPSSFSAGLRFTSNSTNNITHYVDHITITIWHDDPPTRNLSAMLAAENF